MHTWLYGVKSSVFGNDGVFYLGTKIFLQQVEHGRVLLLYTLMPLFGGVTLVLSHLTIASQSLTKHKTQTLGCITRQRARW